MDVVASSAEFCQMRAQDDMNENDALYPIALFVVHHQFLLRHTLQS